VAAATLTDAPQRDAAHRAALDLHEGIAAAEPATGCPRWPSALRLQSSEGELVAGRCKATNLCAYCARLAAVENAEVLAMDAMTNTAPALWSVLTTRTATIDTGAFRRSREAVMRSVRRRWPDAERAQLIEFTTGLGTRSGGDRRPHWNDTWKGVPVDDVDELQWTLARAWCERVDALPKGQHVQPISDTGGLMRYLALHFQKESQQPPEGWRGHRFRTTRGYLAVPLEHARDHARQALRMRRELWKAERAGLVAGQALDAAQAALDHAALLDWSLVRLQALPTRFGDDGLPTTWTTTPVEVTR
jgi:hypothetical protein